MNNKIVARHWRNYTCLDFPKRNVSLLYNNDTKKYGFYEHNNPKKAIAISSQVLDDQITNLRLMCCILAGATGILSAVLFIGYVL